MRGLTWNCLSDRVTINHVDGPAADIVTLTRHELTTEHGKRLDTMAAHAGVVSESQHQVLRADIRLLSTLLGDTLIRHGGEELLKLVEQALVLIWNAFTRAKCGARSADRRVDSARLAAQDACRAKGRSASRI